MAGATTEQQTYDVHIEALRGQLSDDANAQSPNAKGWAEPMRSEL
ncbi:MAG TPA: hypothetical protein VGN11_02580 [Candidatus Baltobacteraceae bacterium]|nr:hypothetical protein [Candidatus Baltobacteraceae bacterium]